MEGEPRRKRRQNVACDSCKLRRVKCDLSNLLVPSSTLDDDDDESNPVPLLQEMVRRHPDVSCTNCKNKGLTCTSESIRNPTKPKKGGKRIAQARELFGKEEEELDALPDPNGAGPSRVRTLVATLDPSLQEGENIKDEINAYRIWRAMSEDYASVTAKAPPLPKGRRSAAHDFGSAHGKDTEFVQIDTDPATNWVNGKPLFATSIVGRVVRTRTPWMPSPDINNGIIIQSTATRSGVTDLSSSLATDTRKRRLTEEGQIMSINGQHDPWHLWSDDQVIVSWGKRERVQERLAERTLGFELSRHLVSMYFQVVHLAFPTVSPESFYVEWLRAGQQSDRMSPALEALCAVVEAWGARYSDHPIILGLTGAKAKTAPKVFKADGTTVPGTAARAHWGRARIPACNALADRAKRIIEANGLFFRPSVTGAQALSLFNLLGTMTDQTARAEEQYMISTLTHSALVEQMSVLNLMWDADGDIEVDTEELPVTVTQLKMKQRRLFWSSMVMDSLWASGSAQAPKMPESDIESAGRWLNAVDKKLPNSTFKILAHFLRCYYRLTKMAREIALDVSIPNRRPGTVDVDHFCKLIRKLWGEIKDLRRAVVVEGAEKLASCEGFMAGFSPMNQITSIRLSGPFLLLLLHQHIRTQLDFRRDMKSSYVVNDDGDGDPEKQKIAKLQELHMQSIDIMLQSCRSQAAMFKVMLPTGLMQTASTFLRVLIATILFMAEVPCNEQGYPTNTLGGFGWTWRAKKEEVGTCVEAMYQLGWAWADVHDVLEAVMVSMERMTPSEEVLEAWSKTSHPNDERIVLELGEEKLEDSRVMDLAMVYWPPDSIPRLVALATEGLDIQSAAPVDLARCLAPDHLQAKSLAMRKARMRKSPSNASDGFRRGDSIEGSSSESPVSRPGTGAGIRTGADPFPWSAISGVFGQPTPPDNWGNGYIQGQQGSVAVQETPSAPSAETVPPNTLSGIASQENPGSGSTTSDASHSHTNRSSPLVDHDFTLNTSSTFDPNSSHLAGFLNNSSTFRSTETPFLPTLPGGSPNNHPYYTDMTGRLPGQSMHYFSSNAPSDPSRYGTGPSTPSMWGHHEFSFNATPIPHSLSNASVSSNEHTPQASQPSFGPQTIQPTSSNSTSRHSSSEPNSSSMLVDPTPPLQSQPASTPQQSFFNAYLDSSVPLNLTGGTPSGPLPSWPSDWDPTQLANSVQPLPNQDYAELEQFLRDLDNLTYNQESSQ
ncbi:hypothetical protein BD324DRAFT_625966 [Kockovaella imperatae]|uniref:Zn(2)-C6 fungal-type domain-containing protein n=1 Tax=Kockovaella imperatae TaxID=4999 RepID=A0A1Y1UHC6_9TREE|nr:hypothetical protein BD324DRAFT_625966 [Kockovaella imperatae]ORX37389.1 hypothetical protein BD324DRAFT_625966 [Kockovaella imperatae]